YGSTKIAAPPLPSSAVPEILEVITGIPQFIASNIGSPKPSIKVGETSASARL
ncbi:MAG: hypothetical protein UY49_C0022G0008, partial [Microgenomates group bacterium GW2011_GWC1_49_7]